MVEAILHWLIVLGGFAFALVVVTLFLMWSVRNDPEWKSLDRRERRLEQRRREFEANRRKDTASEGES